MSIESENTTTPAADAPATKGPRKRIKVGAKPHFHPQRSEQHRLLNARVSLIGLAPRSGLEHTTLRIVAATGML